MFLVSFLIFGPISIADAATITNQKPGELVSLTIPDTDLEIDGCVAPNSLVTITDASAVVGTTVSMQNGRYSMRLTSQTPTIHAIGVYFEDQDAVLSEPASELVALPAKTLTTRTINPSPTVSHSPSSVIFGRTITFFGYGCPGSMVELVIDGNTTLQATVGNYGRWTIDINSVLFSVGTHTYSVRASGPGGYVSSSSRKQSFVVLDSEPTTSAPTPFISANVQDEPDLNIPVVITDPDNGYRSNTRNVRIAGVGPPNTQIEVLVDGVVVGSVFSNSLGEWSFIFAVLGTQQTVSARACSGEVCGMDSNLVEVFVDEGAAASGCSLRVRLDRYRYRDVRAMTGIDVDIQIEDSNSADRYEAVIDWGGVQIDTYTIDGRQSTLHQVYKNIGQYNGSVSVEDRSGCVDTVYFSVDITDARSFFSSFEWRLPLLIVGSLFVGWLYGKRTSIREINTEKTTKKS